VKIDTKKLLVVEDQLLDPCTLEELREELPDNTPRYIVLSWEYHHKADGRIS